MSAARDKPGAISLSQQAEQMRRIGVLTGDTEDDPGVKARLAAFREGLDQLGWSLLGAAVAWPRAARAPRCRRTRR